MERRTRLYLISATILLIGMASAVLIYFAAEDTDSTQEYQVHGNFVTPSTPAQGKKYMHDLEVYGGKAAVLADMYRRWFDSLWEGESLAYTVGSIAGAISLILFLIARNTPSGTASVHAEDTTKSRDQ